MKIFFMIFLSFICISSFAQTFRGNLNNNPYDPNSISNPYGRYGSQYSPDSVNNPYGAGNPYSNKNIKIYDQQGNYRGKVTDNQYDPESINNPYGQYGSKYSPDSINNPYGAGNPYGPGLELYEDE